MTESLSAYLVSEGVTECIERFQAYVTDPATMNATTTTSSSSSQSLDLVTHYCVCMNANVSLELFQALDCFPEERNIPFEALTWLFYTALIVLASLGNTLVCYVVASSRRMHTVTNFYIVNMAVGDLLMTCLCAPITFITVILLRRWPFDEMLCRLVSFSQAVSVFVSAFSLVAISMDRHTAILYPLRARATRASSRATIATIWTLAALCCVPIAITSTTWVPDSPRYRVHQWHVCQEVWQGQGRQLYNIAVLTLQYFLPVLVLGATYARIVAELWSQTGQQALGGGGGGGGGGGETARDARFSRAKRKTVVMMILVVFVYTMCWLPYHVLQIALEVNESLYEWPAIVYVFTVCHWLSMSSCLWNPIIYCLMNAQFRAGFSHVSHCLMCRPVDNPTVHTRLISGPVAGRSVRGRHNHHSTQLPLTSRHQTLVASPSRLRSLSQCLRSTKRCRAPAITTAPEMGAGPAAQVRNGTGAAGDSTVVHRTAAGAPDGINSSASAGAAGDISVTDNRVAATVGSSDCTNNMKVTSL